MVKPFLPPKPSQWAAVRATDEHVLVVAGAGTGKTHTVVGRILYLLGVEMHGERCPAPVSLSSIAAITFTNEAARDLRDALRTALKSSNRRDEAWQVDGARIGTIHSFCLNLLRENALRAGLSPHPVLLEEGEALELATDVARDTLVEALETGVIPELNLLLGTWPTSDIDRWVVDLMRKTDRVRQLDHELHQAVPAGAAHVDASPELERALVRLARMATERLEAVLQRDGRLDFDRIILRTRDLIRDDAGLRALLQRKLHTLIIDEFQDVDPAQKEIAYLLGNVEAASAQGTRLMLVGDPKQSIYRFRGADVSVWNAVEEDFRQGRGRVLPLVENFRSVPAILALVEASAGRLLDEPLNGESHQPYEVRFQPVEPERTAVPEIEPIEFLLVPSGADGKCRSADEIRGIEAEGIARRIVELHAAGSPYREMAILFATWSNVERYRDALRRAGVPCYVLRRDGFLDTREVHDLLLALEVLRDPGDARALFGFLRSPFGGVRDESLLQLVLHGKRPYWKHLDALDATHYPAATAEVERLARAGERITRFSALRDRMPVADLLQELLLETGYLAHLQLLGEDGMQAMANVRQFLAMARELNDISTGDLIRILRERRARGDRVPEALLHGRDEDVVTITSIHVAKGLQWRTVFWADLAGGKASFKDKLIVTRHGIRLGEPDLGAEEQPDEAWKEFRREMVAEEDAERKRLWYVAMTRAMDRLILCGVAQGSNPGKDSAAARFRQLFPALETAGGGGTIAFTGEVDGRPRPQRHSAAVRMLAAATPQPALTPDPAPEGEPEPWPAGERAQLELPRSVIFTKVGSPRHSATAFLAHARCPRRHWFKYVAGVREPELDAAQRDELVSAVQRGQIVHDVLERLREEDELDALLEDAIGRWDDHAPPPESERGRRYREHLRTEVGSIANHPEYRTLADRPNARRELSFLYVRADGEMAHGSIDLAVPADSNQALELLDVKTTQCDARQAAEKAAQYQPQRDVYVTAAQAITGLPVRRFAFQFSRAGVQISDSITASEHAEAAQRFAATAAAISEGEAPLTRFPHECRFCGYRRVRLCPGVRFGENQDADSSSSRAGPPTQLELL